MCVFSFLSDLPPLPSPPLPSPSLPLVTERIHSPFQPKQSPSYIVNITLTVLEHMVHMSSSNLCSRLIMDYSCNHRRFGTRGCTNRVQCELSYIVNIYFTVLDHIVHMSKSNLCSRQIMDYSCNHRRFGTRCCTNRVQCRLSYVIYSHTFVTSRFPYSGN